MKTSLVCLLLLAAVACAAPQAGDMPGAKRAEMAGKMREKIAEKREEMAEKMREMAKEKREEMAREKPEKIAEEKREEMADEKREERAENALGKAKVDEKEGPEARGGCFYLRGPCYGYYGEPGCVYDYCRSYVLDVDPLTGCKCCAEPHPCYLSSYDYYY